MHSQLLSMLARIVATCRKLISIWIVNRQKAIVVLFAFGRPLAKRIAKQFNRLSCLVWFSKGPRLGVGFRLQLESGRRRLLYLLDLLARLLPHKQTIILLRLRQSILSVIDYHRVIVDWALLLHHHQGLEVHLLAFWQVQVWLGAGTLLDALQNHVVFVDK